MEPNPAAPGAGPTLPGGHVPPSAVVRPAAELDPRRRRLLFRATHRGTHETDLLVGGFVRERIAVLDPSELDALEEVMELPDADLSDWLMGRRPVPADKETPMLRAMLDAVRDRPPPERGR